MSRKVRQLRKFYQSSYTVILTEVSNAIKNYARKFRFINTLRSTYPVAQIWNLLKQGWGGVAHSKCRKDILLDENDNLKFHFLFSV